MQYRTLYEEDYRDPIWFFKEDDKTWCVDEKGIKDVPFTDLSKSQKVSFKAFIAKCAKMESDAINGARKEVDNNVGMNRADRRRWMKSQKRYKSVGRI